jgi:competence protein ComEA
MDRSATPWRVLDEADVAKRAGGAGPSAAAASSAPPRLSWALIGGLGLAAALAVGAFAVAASAPSGEVTVEGGSSWAPSGGPRASKAGSSTGGSLAVDVQGAVLHPGLLELQPGSRIGDAIAAAGGYGPRVDAERAGRELNLAATLKDGDRLVVPSRDDPPPWSGSGPSFDAGVSAGGGQRGLVDLNSATAAELDALPGIGPATAKKIIDARTEKPFTSVDDLRNRKIVGSSTLEKFRDLVTAR